VRALNRFIHDVYHEQDIVRAGRIPPEQVFRNSQYRPEMQGVDVPGGIYSHISGVDIVRAGQGEFYVLEDNLRVPSGVSYMLENRKMMMRLFPDLFARNRVAPGGALSRPAARQPARGRADGRGRPHGRAAHARHVQLRLLRARLPRQQMGIELVEGQDLFVQDSNVYMRTTRGPQRVDIIYRRIDDDFMDPLAFRPDSQLGVPGLLSVYRAGRVTLAQRDRHRHRRRQVDLPVRAGHDRLLPRREADPGERADLQVPRSADLAYTLAHIHELVVKEVHGAGGYGMLVGPAASRESAATSPRACRPDRTTTSRSRRSRCRLPDLRRIGPGAAAPRPASVRAVRPGGRDGARRAVPRGAARRLPRGELVAGRRHQGHVVLER